MVVNSLFIIAPPYLWVFVFDLRFVMQYSVFFLVVQSYRRGRDSLLLG